MGGDAGKSVDQEAGNPQSWSHTYLSRVPHVDHNEEQASIPVQSLNIHFTWMN